MTASTVRPAFCRPRLRLSAALAALAAILVPALWAGGAGAAAPVGRGYEMVSPPHKNFGDISVGLEYFGDAAVAHDGEAASYCVTASFSGTSGGMICGDYLSRRDAVAQRWETTPVAPPYCTLDTTDPTYVWQLRVQVQEGISTDMRKVVSVLPEGGGGCPFEPLDPFAPVPSLNLYMFEEVGNPASARLVAPEPGISAVQSPLQTIAGEYVAASSDLSHIVFRSTGQQTPEVPADGQSRLFEWANGTVRLVTKDLGNVPIATESDIASPTPPAFPVGDRAADRFNAVSADGNRIFFVSPPQINPVPSSELYMRENGTTTHHISESECTSSCGAPADLDRFQYATPDGDKVFFVSLERLTDDPTPGGPNLYMYTHSANPASDQNLTLLTRDEEPVDGTSTVPSGNDVGVGVVGVSDDGDDVYFITEGQLVPGGSPAAVGEVKLYRWANDDNPELSFIGRLRDHEGLNWSSTLANPDRYVTPDGEHLLVQTSVPLDPIADQNTDTPVGGLGVPDGSDVYRWSEADGWICASCTDTDGPGGGFVSVREEGPARQTDRERRPINDDGSRVFFRADSALVPQDTNNRRDVYMWEDGRVSLISSGKGSNPSRWVGSSADGDDVFFVTRERLVGWDTDTNIDLYDARVGGGFPEPPPTSVPCVGDECQDSPTGPPAAPGSGSSDFKGSGNVGGGVRSSISGIRGLSASALATLARGGKARLRLRVNRAGKVVVVGRAKVGRRRSLVVSASATAKKAGPVSVPLALSRAARGELRSKGSLRIALTVRFRDARPKVLTLTVKSAASKKGRRS